MKNTKLLPAVLLIGIAVSISYTTVTQGVMSLTPPETTVSKEIPQQEAKIVPFAKVMEPAFAEDYVDTDITTEVQFVATGKGCNSSKTINKYEKMKYITFRALPPGQLGEKNPLSGEIEAQLILIPKDKTDSIFSAKAGDILVVKGRPVVEKYGYSLEYTSVVFVATCAYKTGTETQREASASQTQPMLENQSKTSRSSQQTQGDKKKTSVSTDISSDTAMRLERERALSLDVGKKQQNDLGRILATVNGENISQQDVNQMLNRFGKQIPDEQIPAVTKQIVDGLITQKLIMQFIRDSKIEVSQAEIEKELNKVREDIKSNPGLEGKTLEQVLETHGSSIDNLKNDIVISLSLEKQLGKDIDDKKMSPQAKQKIMEERAQLLIKQLLEKANIDIKFVRRGAK